MGKCQARLDVVGVILFHRGYIDMFWCMRQGHGIAKRQGMRQAACMTYEKRLAGRLCEQHNAHKARDGRAGYATMMHVSPLTMRLARGARTTSVRLACGKASRPCERTQPH